jgi:hypothetical protein
VFCSCLADRLVGLLSLESNGHFSPITAQSSFHPILSSPLLSSALHNSLEIMGDSIAVISPISTHRRGLSLVSNYYNVQQPAISSPSSCVKSPSSRSKRRLDDSDNYNNPLSNNKLHKIQDNAVEQSDSILPSPDADHYLSLMNEVERNLNYSSEEETATSPSPSPPPVNSAVTTFIKKLLNKKKQRRSLQKNNNNFESEGGGAGGPHLQSPAANSKALKLLGYDCSSVVIPSAKATRILGLAVNTPTKLNIHDERKNSFASPRTSQLHQSANKFTHKANKVQAKKIKTLPNNIKINPTSSSSASELPSSVAELLLPSHTSVYLQFLEFLQSEYAAESLIFLKSSYKLRRAPSFAEFAELFHRFIKPHSRAEINISYEVRVKLVQLFNAMQAAHSSAKDVKQSLASQRSKQYSPSKSSYGPVENLRLAQQLHLGREQQHLEEGRQVEESSTCYNELISSIVLALLEAEREICKLLEGATWPRFKYSFAPGCAQQLTPILTPRAV